MFGAGMDKWMLDRMKYVEVEEEEMELEGPIEASHDEKETEIVVNVETRF